MSAEFVAVVGSRAHPNLDLVTAYVRSLVEANPGTLIITGGAAGVDRAAMKAAKSWQTYLPHECGVRIETSWGAREASFFVNQYSLTQGGWLLLRNTAIAAQCHRMVVFPDGTKGGCWDAAREALRFGKPVELRWCDGRVEPYTKARARKS